MKAFDTVILGSGYFSLGYAMTMPDTLIIERTHLCDPTFGGTLFGFCAEGDRNIGAETERLRDFYAEHGLIDGNCFNASVSEAGMCAYALKNNVEILFGSVCIEIVKRCFGYEITVFNNGGFESIGAKRVIDARRGRGKILSVLCRGEISAEELTCTDDFKVDVTRAFREEERVVNFTFFGETDVNFAKAKAVRYLEALLPETGAKILQCAYLMREDASLPPFTDGDIPAVRDISYKTALNAFDAGVKYAEEVSVK